MDFQYDDRWVLADVSRAALSAKEAESFGIASLFPSATENLQSLLVPGPTTNMRVLSPLRPVLCLFPAPEIALLFDDWNASGGATPAPVLSALFSAITRFDFDTASRLSFAQILASGAATQRPSRMDTLMSWRNERAIAEVDSAVNAGRESLALVYGAFHMRDLRAKLEAKYRLVNVSDKDWITAWSIPLPTEQTELQSLQNVGLPVLAYVAVLTLSAVDWFGFLKDLANVFRASPLAEGLGGFTSATTPSSDLIEPLISVFFYFWRHAVVYLALLRWTFDWESRWWAVEPSERS